MEKLQKVRIIDETYFYWFEDETGKWLLARTKQTWYVIPYPDGKGDLIFRMAIIALFTGDADIIKACLKLLNTRKRWPDSLSNSGDARNRIEYYFIKWMYKLGIAKKMKYRSQGSMTRDPYIMLTCAIFWHQHEMIRDLKIPMYIQRPALWHWKKYLETNKQIHKEKYEKWATIDLNIAIAFKYHGFAKFLDGWMCFIARSDKMKKKMIDFVPDWNYVVRMLCGDVHGWDCYDNYKPRDGFIWDASNYKEPEDDELLGPNEPVYLDKGILEFVIKNQSF